MKKFIGCIGQGWIGKNLADDFEARGYTVVRYALEEPYVQNKAELLKCDIVFIAEPTPTTPDGFSVDAIRNVIPLLAEGTIVVIKSTLLPGSTDVLQIEFDKVTILHSPEFLREKSAAHDVAHPQRTIIGIPHNSEIYQNAAAAVLSVLPNAPYTAIMSAREAELVKYAGNCFLFTKVVFMNILYDVAAASGANFEHIKEALVHDSRIGGSHMDPVHVSGHLTTDIPLVRGAGGHCFIKDFEAFRRYHHELLHRTEPAAATLLSALATYNNTLLARTKKDLDLLTAVYGDSLSVS